MRNPPSPRRPRGKDRCPRNKETPFRLTPARREAGIRNLRQANIERKFGCYLHPLAPEHEAKALANLKLADAARAVRGNYFQHGLYSALLPAAIRRAGEDPAEFEAHVLRFERALAAPPGETPSDDEKDLIRAAAELIWRHIRAFRCQGEWERARAALLLGRFDGYRLENVQQAADLAVHLDDIFCRGYEGLAVPLGRVRRRLEDVLRNIYMGRFGRDPQFTIFHHGLHHHSDLDGLPRELAVCPALTAWRVESVEANQKSLPRGSSGAEQLPETSRWSRARRKEWADLMQLLRRIFLGTEPPAGSRLERATDRLRQAAAFRLQTFPRQAQWQTERVREIIERAAKSAPLTPRRMYLTMRRILEAFDASDRVFDHLPKHDRRMQEALQECVYAAYGRRPRWDPLAILDTAELPSDFDLE
jgi:hypothetical protein